MQAVRKEEDHGNNHPGLEEQVTATPGSAAKLIREVRGNSFPHFPPPQDNLTATNNQEDNYQNHHQSRTPVEASQLQRCSPVGITPAGYPRTRWPQEGFRSVEEIDRLVRFLW